MIAIAIIIKDFLDLMKHVVSASKTNEAIKFRMLMKMSLKILYLVFLSRVCRRRPLTSFIWLFFYRLIKHWKMLSIFRCFAMHNSCGVAGRLKFELC